MKYIIMLSAVVTLAAASSAEAQDWNWKGRVAAGKWIEVKGVNGSVRAMPADGDQVEVEAIKIAEDNDPDEVEIEVVEHAGGVTICAVYPSRRSSQPNECRPGEGGRNNVQNNDVKVNFVVRVPRGVHFAGRTVNGAVNATSLSGDVKAHTVNGSVRVSTSSLASASTVNGSIDVSMGRANWSDELHFATVNGGIVIELPGGANAQVHASTVNGSIDTDFPLTVRGRWGPRQMSGTIGNGGRELSLNTVNGDIELRRRN